MIVGTEVIPSATPWPQSAVVIHKPKTFQDCVSEIVDEFMEQSRVMGRPEINVATRMMAAEIVMLRRELAMAQVSVEDLLNDRRKA